MARDCPKVSDMKAANTPTSGGRGSANRGRGRGSMATSGSAAHGHMARDCPKVSYMKAANTPTGGGGGSANRGRPWIYGNFRQCQPM
ncbi:hypothetical protein HPP92_017757, partial [Vanilla planifolia]